MRVLVALASGEVVGITLISEALWPGTGAETAAIPGSVLSVAASRVNAAVPAGGGGVPARCKGAVKPGPNPAAGRSEAWGVGGEAGAVAAAGEARRSGRTRTASTRSTPRAA